MSRFAVLGFRRSTQDLWIVMSRNSREQEIFEACLACPPGERSRFIEEACGEDRVLADRIRKLLAAHELADDESLFSLIPNPDWELQQIGPYVPIRVLGEGGMGLVYEAEQRFPVRRRVALKLVRWGMDSRQVFARFDAERQALAVMDHPNIAKVLDAGEGPDGRPYFVMELVDGVPITRYCDQHRLSLRDRLRLFVTLCRAVQHAHQKGVIHRDLKPSNVLVCAQDGVPVPKVIDFGIAKAVGPKLAEDLELTQGKGIVGTPSYMSPEQAGRVALDIDTRSDIYSLGVMLHELLVGVLPLESEAGMGDAPAAADTSGEQKAPSSRFIELGSRGESIAHARSTTPAQLVRELKEDLDWITLKAMAIDRTERYDTAASMALDIERSLGDEPVLARSGGSIYRGRKFLKRYRPLLAAASIAVFALTLGVVGMLVGLFEADTARLEAEHQAVKARSAEREANLRLRNALLAQAIALRRGYAPGRRAQSLNLLAQAAEIGPGEDLRDEAIAGSMLTDLEEIARWSRPVGETVSISFQQGLDRYALGLRSGKIEVRASESARLEAVLAGTDGIPWVMNFSPDGVYLAVKYHGEDSVSGACFRVWDVDRERVILQRPGMVQGAALAFSPDSRLLAVGERQGVVALFDVRSQRVQGRLAIGGDLTEIKFSPDGSLIAAGTRQGMVEIRRTADGSLLRKIRCHSPAYALGWNGSGRLLAVGYGDSRVLVQAIDSDEPAAFLRGHQAEVVRVAFHPTEPLLLTYSWDETSRLWNAASGEQILRMREQALGFSRDGARVAFVGGDDLGLWRLRQGETFQTLYGHSGKGPLCVDSASGGTLLASGGNDGVRIWSLTAGGEVGFLPAGRITDLFFAEGDRSLVSCGSRGLIRWRLDGGERSDSPGREVIDARPCRYAAADPTREYVASFHEGGVAVLRSLKMPGTIVELATYPGMAHPALSAGGILVAAGNWRGDRTVVWDGRSGKQLVELLAGKRSVAVAFSPDGELLVTGSSEDYRFWKTGEWREIFRVKRPDRFSNLPGKVSFSRDGSLLALVLDQATLRVMDARSLEKVANLSLSDPQSFSGIAFSPAGNRLILSTAANRIHIWNFAPIADVLGRFGVGLDFVSRRWKADTGASDETRRLTQSAWADPFPRVDELGSAESPPAGSAQ